jgi:hypothetical protein
MRQTAHLGHTESADLISHEDSGKRYVVIPDEVE